MAEMSKSTGGPCARKLAAEASQRRLAAAEPLGPAAGQLPRGGARRASARWHKAESARRCRSALQEALNAQILEGRDAFADVLYPGGSARRIGEGPGQAV